MQHKCNSQGLIMIFTREPAHDQCNVIFISQIVTAHDESLWVTNRTIG